MARLPKYLVTLHRNLPDLKDRHEVEIEAPSEEAAAQHALNNYGQRGWVVTHVERMGGSDFIAKQDKGCELAFWNGWMPQVGDTVKVIGEATHMSKASEWKVTHTAPSTQRARIVEAPVGLRQRITVVDWKDLEPVRNADTERDDLKRIISKQGDENVRLCNRVKRLETVAKRARAKRRASEKTAAALDMENQKLREALRNMEEQAIKDVNAIKQLHNERDEILSKNRELVKEIADTKEHIRGLRIQNDDKVKEIKKQDRRIAQQAQQIDDLIHERPIEHQQGPTRDVSWEEPWAPQLAWDEELTLKTLIGQAIGAASMCWSPAPTGIFWPEKAEWILGGVINEIEKLQFKRSRRHYTGPLKPVEALVKEQDDDAQLWALAFNEQFDIPEADDMAVTTWFANAMMTAVDKWRNAHPERETKGQFFDGVTVPNDWTATENLAEKTRSNSMPNPSFGIQKVAGHVINPDGSFGSAFKFEDNGTYEFVNAPKHYNDHPSGVECQVIIRECKDPMISFAMKHLWRSQWGGKPGQTIDQDFSKAIEYIQLEQARRAGKARL